MGFNLSSGLSAAILGDTEQTVAKLNVDTISFGDGDGSVISGADTINDSGAALSTHFAKHDWILIISGGANNNKLVKALSVTTSKIEIVAGSFTAVAAGSNVCLVKLASIGNLMRCFQNGTMSGRTGARPTDADTTESGTELIKITLNGSSFSAGVSLNGLNLEADVAGTTLNRATDPETAASEVWQGTGLVAGTVGYMRWYANAYTTGASTTAIRMDGTVATSGADITMANGTTISIGAISNVTSVDLSVEGV